MKIAIWKTGHPIADTVADALKEGFNARVFNTKELSNKIIEDFDLHVGYGILRGTDAVFKAASRLQRNWVQVDRGYWKPFHYSGYYRVSCRGTQAIYSPDAPHAEHSVKLEPFRYPAKNSYTLIVPPTDHVRKFFGGGFGSEFDKPYESTTPSGDKTVVRFKGDDKPIEWDKITMVETFNSSIGWEAVRRGIPCMSHGKHSTVGSFYGMGEYTDFLHVKDGKILMDRNFLDEFRQKFYMMDRNKLFSFMAAHQFTLKEIAEGRVWPLMRYYLERPT